MLGNRTIHTTLCLLAASVTLLAPLSASALTRADPLVEGARLCTQSFQSAERQQGIPTHLLAAISSTESGRWHDGLGLALPWPWTINVEGQGHYFNSKAEAVAKTAAFLRSGARSVDVGCMQVNLKHHPDAFRTLEEAFDPQTNVNYGAKFLRSNYDDLGNWVKATAAYHSRTPVYGNRYLGLIEKNWQRIVAKVQQARSTQGLVASHVTNPGFNTAALQSTTSTPIDMLTGARPANASAPGMNRIASTHNVRLIKVSERPQMGNEVLVVRAPVTATAPAPAASTPTITLSEATQPSDMVLRPSGDSVRRVTIDSTAPSANSGTASASRFVFSN